MLELTISLVLGHSVAINNTDSELFLNQIGFFTENGQNIEVDRNNYYSLHVNTPCRNKCLAVVFLIMHALRICHSVYHVNVI